MFQNIIPKNFLQKYLGISRASLARNQIFGLTFFTNRKKKLAQHKANLHFFIDFERLDFLCFLKVGSSP